MNYPSKQREESMKLALTRLDEVSSVPFIAEALGYEVLHEGFQTLLRKKCT